MDDQTKNSVELLAELNILRQEVSHWQQRALQAEKVLAAQSSLPQSADDDHFHYIAASSDGCIYVTEVTEDGRWINCYLSPDIEDLTGYALAELSSEWSFWASRIIYADDRAAAAAQAMRISMGQNSQSEYRLVRADGQIVWVRDRVTVRRVGTAKFLYGVVSNVTDDKFRDAALAKLLEMSRALVATRDPSRLLNQAVRAAVDIAPAADRGTLQLLDPDGETLRTVVTSTPGENLAKTLVFRANFGIAGHALVANQVISVNDTLTDPRFVPGKNRLRVRSLLVAPLVVQDQLLGTLSLSSERTGVFFTAHEALIQLIADQIAAALENARLFDARHQAEANLRQSHDFLQSTMDALATHLAILDEYGQVIAVNAAWKRYASLTKTDIVDNLGPDYVEICKAIVGSNSEDWTALAQGIRRVKEGHGSQFYMEYLCPYAGQAQWFSLRVTKFQSQMSVRIVIAREDVTERNFAEQALRDSEKKYRTLTDQLPVGIYRTTEDGRFLHANPALADILGYDNVADLIKVSAESLYDDPQARQQWLAAWKAHGEFASVEKKLRTKDRRVIWVRDTAHVIFGEQGEVAYIDGMIENITQQKASQEALRKSEANLRAIFDSSLQAFLLIDREYKTQAFNKRADEGIKTILGQTMAEGRSIHQVVPNWDLAEFNNYFDKALRGEVVRLEHSVRGIDDSEHWFEFTFTPVLDDDDQVTGVCFSTLDINERRKSEEQLRLLATAISSIDDGVLITDAQLDIPGPKIIFVNEGFCRMTGYDQADLIGQTPRILQGPKTDRSVLRTLKAVLSRGQSFQGETINYRQDQSEYSVAWHISPVFGPDNEILYYVSIHRDVTDVKLLEAQLRQSQKMEAVGRLAGGVAHDFNNLLTAIKGYSQLIYSQLEPTDPVVEDIEQIILAGDRAAALTQQLLSFSRQEIVELEIVNLNSIITDMKKMLSRLIGETIILVTKLDPALGVVKADPKQMGQVILNLVVNARDAMAAEGQIGIETKNVTLSSPQRSGASAIRLDPGSYVQLSVIDQGVGIPEKIRSQIFDPFFTTKGVGEGTGLGLSTVYAIVRQSGGDINVLSDVGQGTAMCLYLPRIDEPNEDQDDIADTTILDKVEAAQVGSETILLVEDDVLVRSYARRVLTHLGYQILEASQGDEALQIAEKYETSIDLLLTDVVMPGGISGRQLGEWLQAFNPQVRIIYMSGYTDDVIIRHGIPDMKEAFLQKPFTPTDLTNKVREILDRV